VLFAVELRCYQRDVWISIVWWIAVSYLRYSTRIGAMFGMFDTDWSIYQCCVYE
jgi:hypothetical protein